MHDRQLASGESDAIIILGGRPAINLDRRPVRDRRAMLLRESVECRQAVDGCGVVVRPICLEIIGALVVRPIEELAAILREVHERNRVAT
jgi:hypothetical protein